MQVPPLRGLLDAMAALRASASPEQRELVDGAIARLALQIDSRSARPLGAAQQEALAALAYAARALGGETQPGVLPAELGAAAALDASLFATVGGRPTEAQAAGGGAAYARRARAAAAELAALPDRIGDAAALIVLLDQRDGGAGAWAVQLADEVRALRALVMPAARCSAAAAPAAARAGPAPDAARMPWDPD